MFAASLVVAAPREDLAGYTMTSNRYTGRVIGKHRVQVNNGAYILYCLLKPKPSRLRHVHLVVRESNQAQGCSPPNPNTVCMRWFRGEDAVFFLSLFFKIGCVGLYSRCRQNTTNEIDSMNIWGVHDWRMCAPVAGESAPDIPDSVCFSGEKVEGFIFTSCEISCRHQREIL